MRQQLIETPLQHAKQRVICMYEIIWLEDLCNDVLGVHVATDRIPGLDETGRLLLLLQLPSDVFVAVQTVQ